MSVSTLNINTALPLTLDDPSVAAGAKRSRWTTVFDENSKSAYSAVIAPGNYGLLLQAASLRPGDQVVVQCVSADGDIAEDIILADRVLGLRAGQNMLFIPTPTRIRLVYRPASTDNIGSFQVYVTPVPVEQFAAMAPFLTTALS